MMNRQKTLEASRPPRRPDRRRWEPPALRFSPTAWAKLLYLRDSGDSEVGGFGISASDDLLYVEDVQLVRQVCTAISVAFDDAGRGRLFRPAGGYGPPTGVLWPPLDAHASGQFPRA